RAIHNQINPLFSADAKPGQLVHQQPQESNAFYILNQTTMPGILLEIAFMTNPDDRRLLKNKSFRKKMVQKIFLGVVEYSYGQEANEKDLSE
ncbi:MAG TPA: N-acetylmuramoyl-L-alanine amidase, partial [Bacillota bacterium]|nr:N-acetylmuramoyl-L-alanine amidase [Bacillota bacterium]